VQGPDVGAIKELLHCSVSRPRPCIPLSSVHRSKGMLRGSLDVASERAHTYPVYTHVSGSGVLGVVGVGASRFSQPASHLINDVAAEILYNSSQHMAASQPGQCRREVTCRLPSVQQPVHVRCRKQAVRFGSYITKT
jgi:hypothetical protein